MKLIIAALAVGMAGCAAWGQTTLYQCDDPRNKVPCSTKPLKCGKYQHVEWQIRAKVIGIPGGDPYEHVPGSEYCADTMHSVTEKEWQEILSRLKALEHPAITGAQVSSPCRDQYGKPIYCVIW